MWAVPSIAQSLDLYIVQGQRTMVDGASFSLKTISQQNSFPAEVRPLKSSKEVSSIKITNSDSLDHVLILQPGNHRLFIAKAEILDTAISLKKGSYTLRDNDELESHLGVTAMLEIATSKPNQFYWQINEYESDIIEKARIGEPIDFTNYSPDYFLINGLSHPDIDTSKITKVRASVGDTVYVEIMNSGRSVHPIHFHGFHFFVDYSSVKPWSVGWEKDTYAVLPGERVSFRFIPDKKGKYPVHDHNLVAVSGNRIYPNGMFTIMHIE